MTLKLDLNDVKIKYYPLDRVIELIDECDSLDMLAHWMDHLRRNEAFLNIMYEQSNRWMKLFSIQTARAWPVKYAEAYATFVMKAPYMYDYETRPCCYRQRFLSEVLQDSRVPKEIRVQLWRAFNFKGFYVSYYYKGEEWNVPESLYDHHSYRHWISITKRPGWEDIRYSDQFLFGYDNRPAYFDSEEKKVLYEAIEEDSVSGLMMPMAISGARMNKTIMRAILKCKAVNIATYLYQNDAKFRKLINPRAALFDICANWSNKDCVPFVSLLEEYNPGLVNKTMDAFGHDALWYTLYNMDEHQVATKAAKCGHDPLDIFLMAHGCNPNRKNSVGLSFKDLTV